MNTTIELKLFATLRKYAPDNADRLAIEPGSTIADLIEMLGIPLKEAKLIFVNGSIAKMDTVLEGSERVGIFPPVGGG